MRHGYAIPSVDAALGRIEDAFAARERQAVVTRSGARAWVGQTREDRRRPCSIGSPAPRASASTGSASCATATASTRSISWPTRSPRYLETGDAVTVEQVRSVAFRMQRGGYREAQVDAVLDAVVDVMLAVI